MQVYTEGNFFSTFSLKTKKKWMKNMNMLSKKSRLQKDLDYNLKYKKLK